MHSDCIQASPWLILGNFRLKCSFSFCSSVGPEIKCQILTLPQPVNLVICKTQMQTLSLQLHLRSWQTQANWCCLAFSSPSLCSLAFFLLPQSQLSSFAGNFVGDLCPAWSCLPERGCVLPRFFLLKQAFPCPNSHPTSASIPDAQNLTTSQWEGSMSCFRWGLPFYSLAGWLLRNSGFFPMRNSRGKIPSSRRFLSKCRASPGRAQPDFKWKCLLSASFTISLQLETTK